MDSDCTTLGLGWSSCDGFLSLDRLGKVEYVLQKMLGWLITALAISLGAPFWYDTLTKVLKIRNGDKKQNRTASNNSISK